MNFMRMREHLTYANVVATIALVLAVGGGATALALTLPKNSVHSKQIAKGAVKTSDIGKDAVTGDKVKESSLGKVPLAVHADSADSATTAGSATNAAHAAVADSLGGSVSPTNVVHTQNASGAFTNTLELDVNGFGRFWLYCDQNTVANNEDDELSFNESDAVQNALVTGLMTDQEVPFGNAEDISTVDTTPVDPNASREYGPSGRFLYVHYVMAVIGTGKTLEITAGGFDDGSTPGCAGQLHGSISG
jgi:hypothetical protein